MARPTPRQQCFAFLCALALSALLTAGVSPDFVLSFVPVLVLVAVLIAGAFPGERLIERMRARHAAGGRARRDVGAPLRRAPFVRPVGRDAAFALAMRPPPAAVVHA